MQKPRIPVLLAALVALLAAFAVACGGGDSGSDDGTPAQTQTGETQTIDGTPVPGGTDVPGETNDPGATPEPHDDGPSGEPELTDDQQARDASRAIRDIERADRRLSSRLRNLETSVARASGSFFGAPEEPTDDWFDECCDDVQKDISEELSDAGLAIADLIAVYEAAGDESGVEVARQIGTHVANIDALLAVLAGLPTSDGARSILDDMSLELVAFEEQLSNLI